MEKKKNVFEARSMEDGIVFCSNKFPALCYESRIDQSGNIETQTLPTIISRFNEMGVSISINSKKTRKVEKNCKIAIFIVAILSIIMTKQVSIAIGLMYFSMIALKDLIEFSQLSFSIKLGAYKSTGRFHSAEHMVINAYEKKQNIPSMAELKKASRFDKSCGSKKYIDKIVILGLVFILIAASPFIEIYMYFIGMALMMLFAFFQTKYNLLGFLQILVTNKPTERELKVALAGIELFEKMEKEMPEACCPLGAIIMRIDIYDEEEGAEK